MSDFSSRVARVAAENGVHIYRNSFPLICRLTRDLLGGADANAFDGGQILAALQGVKGQNSIHFLADAPPAAVGHLSPMQKLDLANERQVQREATNPPAMFGNQEFADEKERQRVMALPSHLKAAWADAQTARKRAEGGK